MTNTLRLRHHLLAMITLGALPGACGGSADSGGSAGSSGDGGVGGTGSGGEPGAGGTGAGGTAGTGAGGTAGSGGTGAGGTAGSGAGGTGACPPTTGGTAGSGGAPAPCNCTPTEYSVCYTYADLPLVTYECAGALPPAGPCPDLDALHPLNGGGCVTWTSGPEAIGGQCCYMVRDTTCIPGSGGVGRPFTVAGQARTASSVSRSDWSERTDGLPGLNARTRAALAARWQRDARLEHASIASFARLTLELLALGAPAELVAASQAASLDEIEHARLCFGLAGRLGGAPVGPGRLPVEGALGEVDLVSVAVAAAREGCVGETIAALVAAEQFALATDQKTRAALDRIATDEARHAELSFRVVRWAIEEGGEPVRVAVERAFAEPADFREPVALLDAAELEDWHAFGRLSSDELARAVERALTEVVGPCARALLASTIARAPS